MPEPTVDRRSFLLGGAAFVGGAGAAIVGRAAWDGARADVPPDEAGPGTTIGTDTVPFHGPRQAGVATPPQAFASFVAYDLLAGADRDALIRLMRIWTDDAARLTQGKPALADTEPELAAVPARLTVTLGLGPGFFAAGGLTARQPSWLAPLPTFGIDRLEDRWCGGDLLLQVCSDDAVTVAHAVRMLTKDARTFVTTRWTQNGFRRARGSEPAGTTMRNLMGQVDGTRNLVDGTHDDLVWHDDSAPAWLVGGTSLVLRRIAMDLDTWDEVDRPGREAVVGRRLDTGAPLTGTREHDEPDLDATDDLGFTVIDTAAHIRRARTHDDSQRFLRRVYNYAEPAEAGAGASSGAGLLFAAYQRDVTAQFVPVQRQLDSMDLLNTWTTPIGSAVFAIPGGCAEGDHLARALLE
jgi:dye decolorizing peroxidase